MPEHAVQPTRRRRREKKALDTRSNAVIWLDRLIGALLVLLMVAAPWLFGCTEDWSVRLMNVGAILTGSLALVVYLLERSRNPRATAAERGWTPAIFLLSNVGFLLYCLIAALNARATFSLETQAFTYREGVISWLPTSYDRARSLQFLLNAFACFSIFWSLYFWVRQSPQKQERDSLVQVSPRLRFLLWIFSVNGFLLGLQGLLQRLSNQSQLLWFRTPYTDDPKICFGPFAYRGNAADYLNLVWPVIFGLWYALANRRTKRAFGFGDGPELMLLPMFMVTTAASFATLSRGGAVVAGLMLVLLLGIILLTRASRALKLSLGLAVISLVIIAFSISGTLLADRFRRAATDNMSGRTEIYQNARQIADDFRWLGTGPGTFLSVYHLYRETPDQDWAAFLHDDWLETRVTFGRIGMGIVLLQLVLLGFWTIQLRPRWVSSVLTLSLAVSITGCLIHAKRDFPFQTYGVFFTFIIVCAFIVLAVERHFPTPSPVSAVP